jgi:cold shock CspA family protein/ribosome-associated translation inhibitor RaiA
MKLPLQITFRNMESSQIVEEWIREEAAKLDTFYNRIMGCHVAVAIPHGHHRNGKPYHVRIDLILPGKEIVIKREANLGNWTRRAGVTKLSKRLEVETPHKNLRIAIHDAFKVVGRRLQDFARLQRGDIKSHEPLPEARISKILREQGYGFFVTEDGREIYFHKDSVLNRAFGRLRIGTTVNFVEEQGEKGLQASTVRIIGKRRVRRAPWPTAATAG